MLMELGYSLQNVEKQLNKKYHDTVHSGSTVVPCGLTVRRTGERHGNADSWFSKFCKCDWILQDLLFERNFQICYEYRKIQGYEFENKRNILNFITEKSATQSLWHRLCTERLGFGWRYIYSWTKVKISEYKMVQVGLTGSTIIPQTCYVYPVVSEREVG